jgi:hypothetical protein
MRLARDKLVKLRNEYLRKNRPETLALLEQAEKSTSVYRSFVDESVFARILKRQSDGSFQVDNVDAFRVIFKDESGDMMRGLVQIAKTQPGGVPHLQSIALKFYKANVIPEGSSILDRNLHNQFIKRHEETLTALFGDPKLLKFGTLEAKVAKSMAHAERVALVLKRSPLAKFGGIAPERMGKAVFQEAVSEKNIKQTLIHLNSSSPEAAASFMDAVGRDVFRRITPDGKLSTGAISKLITEYGGKLQQVFGPQYVKDLEAFRRAIMANLQTVAGKEIPTESLIGRFARAIITPPLTKRGRLQTWVEALRKKTANDAINAAVRDPDILRAIIINKNKDIRSTAALNILGQTGGSALALQE